MTTVTHSPFQSSPLSDDALWTTPLGRGFSVLLVVSVLMIVILVIYGGVRDASVSAGPEWLAATWGWMPSYLAALATPFLWPLLRRRVLGRRGGVDFLPEITMGGSTVILVEVLNGAGSGGTFSWSDVMAALAGALSAFLLYRAVVGPSRTTIGDE